MAFITSKKMRDQIIRAASKTKGLTGEVPGSQPSGDISNLVVPIVYGKTVVEAVPVLLPSCLWKYGTVSTQGGIWAICEGPTSGSPITIWQGDATTKYPAQAHDKPFWFTHDWGFKNGSRSQTAPAFLSGGTKSRRTYLAGVPGSAPYRITISDPDYGPSSRVTVSEIILGTQLVKASGSPTDKQFNPGASYIDFNAAQAGWAVKISYDVYIDSRFDDYGNGGTACLYNDSLWVSDDNTRSATPETIRVEIPGFLGTSDVNPSDVLYDLLTNSVYALDLATSKLSFTNGQDGTAASSYHTWCEESGLLISVAMAEAQPAADWIDQILVSSDGALVWSDGLLKVYPQAETSVGSFTAWATPVVDLDEDDIRGGVIIRTENAADTPNEIPVSFIERTPGGTNPSPDQLYQKCTVSAGETANINATGLRRSEPVDSMLHSRSAAQKLSKILSRRAIHYQNEYEFTLSPRHIMLEPFDLVTLSYDLLGLDHKTLRILSIERQQDLSLRVTAQDWLGLPHPSTLGELEAGDPQSPNIAAAPSDIGEIYIRSNPDPTKSEVLVAAAGLDPTLNGAAEIWYSWDETNWKQAGVITNSGIFGHLTTAIVAAVNLDESTTLIVNCDGTAGTIPEAATLERSGQQAILIVDAECISYEHSALASGEDYTFEVTGITRGALGTDMVAHDLAAPVLLLNTDVLKIPVTKVQQGNLLYIKALATNPAGTAAQALGDVTTYQYEVPLIEIPTGECPFSETFQALNYKRWTLYACDSKLSIGGSGYAGGYALRSEGGVSTLVLDINFPYDASKTYELRVRARNAADPTTGSNNLTVGLIGITADGDTWCGKDGGSPALENQYIGLDTDALVEEADWTTAVAYWSGVSGPGEDGGATLLVPGSVSSNVRYVRLFITFDGGTSEDGILEVDEIGIRECEDGQRVILNSIPRLAVSDRNYGNIWPNGTSELPIPSNAILEDLVNDHSYIGGTINYAFEYGWIEDVSTDAYSGACVRRLQSSGSAPDGARSLVFRAYIGPRNMALLSCRMKTMLSDSRNCSFAIEIGMYNAAGTRLSYSYDQYLNQNSTNGWVYLSCAERAPEGTVYAEWVISAWEANADDVLDVYVDNICASIGPSLVLDTGMCDSSSGLITSQGPLITQVTTISGGSIYLAMRGAPSDGSATLMSNAAVSGVAERHTGQWQSAANAWRIDRWTGTTALAGLIQYTISA